VKTACDVREGTREGLRRGIREYPTINYGPTTPSSRTAATRSSRAAPPTSTTTEESRSPSPPPDTLLSHTQRCCRVGSRLIGIKGECIMLYATLARPGGAEARLFRQGSLGGHDLSEMTRAPVMALNGGEAEVRVSKAIEGKTSKCVFKRAGRGDTVELNKVENVRPRQSQVVELTVVHEPGVGFDILTIPTAAFLAWGKRGRSFQYRLARQLRAGESRAEAATALLRSLVDGSGTMTWVHTVTCRPGQDPSLWPLKFWAPSPELTLPLLGSIGTIDD